jgi:heme-degrading monooxygenase HmoA
MYISVTTLNMIPDKINDFIRTYTILAPTVAGSQGLLGAKLLVNRLAGQVLIVGIYDNEENAKEFAHNVTYEGSLYSLQDICTEPPTRTYFEVPYEINYTKDKSAFW